MKLYLIISRKNLGIILCLLTALVVTVGTVSSQRLKRIDGSTNALRTEYLQRLNIQVDDSRVTSKSIVIPGHFNGIYREYNRLQKESGFDLSKYKGKRATLYSYPIIGSEGRAELIVYKDSIIGGSVTPNRVGAAIKPLVIG